MPSPDTQLGKYDHASFPFGLSFLRTSLTLTRWSWTARLDPDKGFLGKGFFTAGLVLWMVFRCSGLVLAADMKRHDVRIAIADESEQTKRIVKGLQARFPLAQVMTEFVARSPSNKDVIYIAVGPPALRALLERAADSVIISIFTSNQAYRTILASMPNSLGNAVTAIYAEPAPASQAQLIAMLYKRRVRVAVLLSDKTVHLLSLLRQVADRENIDLTVEHVAAGDHLNRVLNRIADVPVLLAIPDSTIYSADNIRTILVTTYRHNQAVIGFSASLVAAGATASTVSSIDDVLVQAEEFLSAFIVSGKLPEPQFPKYFNVVINDQVARSINVVVDERVRRLSRQPSTKP